MKKLMKLATALLLVMAFANTSNAQFSAGIDLALPFEDGYTFGYGVSAGYEHKIGDNMGVGGSIGYIRFGMEDIGEGFFENFSASSSNIPILGQFKYYFADNESGFYGKAELGMTLFSTSISYEYEALTGFDANFNPVYTTEKVDESNSEFYLTYGFGAGMLVTEQIDISAAYRIVSGDGGSFGYMDVAARYNF